LAHTLPDATVYWHLGDAYLGFTKTFHQMALHPPPGKHKLTLVDDRGNRLEQWFEAVVKEGN
jgi:penicillin-binding protein 1C